MASGRVPTTQRNRICSPIKVYSSSIPLQMMVVNIQKGRFIGLYSVPPDSRPQLTEALAERALGLGTIWRGLAAGSHNLVRVEKGAIGCDETIRFFPVDGCCQVPNADVVAADLLTARNLWKSFEPGDRRRALKFVPSLAMAPASFNPASMRSRTRPRSRPRSATRPHRTLKFQVSDGSVVMI